MLDIRCPEHLAEVRAFAASIGLEDQLQKQLDYLSLYGFRGLPPAERPPEREQNRCVLTKDFAPHSFEFSVWPPGVEPWGGGRSIVHGGLIFQSPAIPAHGGAPSFTVSLAEGTGWFIHT